MKYFPAIHIIKKYFLPVTISLYPQVILHASHRTSLPYRHSYKNDIRFWRQLLCKKPNQYCTLFRVIKIWQEHYNTDFVFRAIICSTTWNMRNLKPRALSFIHRLRQLLQEPVAADGRRVRRRARAQCAPSRAARQVRQLPERLVPRVLVPASQVHLLALGRRFERQALHRHRGARRLQAGGTRALRR